MCFIKLIFAIKQDFESSFHGVNSKRGVVNNIREDVRATEYQECKRDLAKQVELLRGF